MWYHAFVTVFLIPLSSESAAFHGTTEYTPKEAKPVFEEIYVSMGRKVYEERSKRKMSQADLGKLCGVTASHIRHIERAERVASLPLVLTLLQVLQLSPIDFLQATESSNASHTQSGNLEKREGTR